MTDLPIVQYGRGQLIAIKGNQSTDRISDKELCFKEMILSDKQELRTESEILRLLLMLTNEQGNSQCLQTVIRSVEERAGAKELGFGKVSGTSCWEVNGQA